MSADEETPAQADGEEQGALEAAPEQAELPALKKNQVWQGADEKETRLVITVFNEKGEDKVSYTTDPSGEGAPEEQTVTVAEFDEWKKRFLGVVG